MLRIDERDECGHSVLSSSYSLITHDHPTSTIDLFDFVRLSTPLSLSLSHRLVYVVWHLHLDDQGQSASHLIGQHRDQDQVQVQEVRTRIRIISCWLSTLAQYPSRPPATRQKKGRPIAPSGAPIIGRHRIASTCDHRHPLRALPGYRASWPNHRSGQSASRTNPSIPIPGVMSR